MDTTRIVLVGAGGYAQVYVDAMLNNQPERPIAVVGIVDPYVSQSRFFDLIREKGIPLYDTVEAFYAQDQADLAIVSTPLQFHAQQAIYCMEHGSHVLVEKPIAATVELARQMMAARDATGKTLAVGYQLCYDAAMLRLKADVDAGVLGAPKRLRAYVLFPRDLNYYRRGLGWAGKKLDEQGRPIFDSVAANATAHYLENMLWLVGPGYEGASIESLEAETARANAIEMYDTAVMRMHVQGGAVLHFATSHAAGREHPVSPMFEYEFERAVVTCGDATAQHIRARFADGAEKDYGLNATSMPGLPKLWMVIDAIHGKTRLPGTAQAAAAHTVAMEKVLEVCPQPHVFEEVQVRLDEEMRWVPGLAEHLDACYDTWQLPSERGGWLR